MVPMKITNRKHFPSYLQRFLRLKGICIGTCINKNSDMDDLHVAHAHSSWNDPFCGWICLRHKFRLKQKLLMLHEMAHLIANVIPTTPAHGKLWKETVIHIGGTFKTFQYKTNGKVYEYLDYTHRHH